MSYSPLYVEFFHHFNVTEDYFECHEVLEALWLETARDPFYQGLLQVAVCLYHHRNCNLGGARKLMEAALTKLAPYGEPVYRGIHLGSLKTLARQYYDKLHSEGHDFTFSPFRIQVIDPELRRLVQEFGVLKK
ncbi:DUF309 domain-containing protein [Pasteuria penetrans]|uniref:DUF309 domain-containing protein n=1 Tax=Pasteuria penetrans TaxID=86005 RepID=UPI000FB71F86|nr:DUF309 domain-containing protein [Pasteuria penetrans]